MRPELIPFATLQRQRWQNNGGWTREVARGGGTCWDWRVSVADVETDGPFSLFPGIARELRILSGAGVALDFADGRRHILTPQQPRLRFDGESAITSRLLAGPVRDFNLMWRRDLLNAKLTEAEWQGSHTLSVQDGEALLLFVSQGSVTPSGQALRATRNDSLLWRTPAPATIHLTADHAAILLVRIRRI